MSGNPQSKAGLERGINPPHSRLVFARTAIEAPTLPSAPALCKHVNLFCKYRNLANELVCICDAPAIRINPGRSYLQNSQLHLLLCSNRLRNNHNSCCEEWCRRSHRTPPGREQQREVWQWVRSCFSISVRLWLHSNQALRCANGCTPLLCF